MSEKARIAKKLYYILDNIQCTGCPLNAACNVMLSVHNASLCSITKNESEGTINE